MYILHVNHLLPTLNRIHAEDEAKLGRFLFALSAVVEGEPHPGEHTTVELAEFRELLVELRCATRVGAPDALPKADKPEASHDH